MGATRDARAVAGPWRFASLIPSGCRLTPIHKVMGDHASMTPPPPGLVVGVRGRTSCSAWSGVSVKMFSAHVAVVLRLVVSGKRFSTHGRAWEIGKSERKQSKERKQRDRGRRENREIRKKQR